jgi:hypothetical protein
MIGEAFRVIGRGVLFALKALASGYWILISLLLGVALLGGFIAMAGAFAGSTDTKLLGSALLAIGGMGFFFLLLWSDGLVPFPDQLNIPAQSKETESGQKDKQ